VAAPAEISRDPALARWLVARRGDVERALSRRLGAAAPAPGAPEAEALRRFRSFAGAALARGHAPAPSLDGLRVPEATAEAVLEAWCAAAAEVAGPRHEAVRSALSSLAAHFCASLRTTAPGRRRRGAPRSGRRAVSAAIDRVADAYLAIGVDDRRIVDANPAAGALLGRPRDALLESEAVSFLAPDDRDTWWAELEALAEGADVRRFAAAVRDAAGRRLRVDASLTRHARRGRVLALALLRPAPAPEPPLRCRPSATEPRLTAERTEPAESQSVSLRPPRPPR